MNDVYVILTDLDKLYMSQALEALQVMATGIGSRHISIAAFIAASLFLTTACGEVPTAPSATAAASATSLGATPNRSSVSKASTTTRICSIEDGPQIQRTFEVGRLTVVNNADCTLYAGFGAYYIPNIHDPDLLQELWLAQTSTEIAPHSSAVLTIGWTEHCGDWIQEDLWILPRLVTSNPPRDDNGQDHHRPAARSALAAVGDKGDAEQGQDQDHRKHEDDERFGPGGTEGQQAEQPQKRPFGAGIGAAQRRIGWSGRAFGSNERSDDNHHDDRKRGEKQILPHGLAQEGDAGRQFLFVLGVIGFRIDNLPRQRRSADSLLDYQPQVDGQKHQQQGGDNENVQGEKATQRIAADDGPAEQQLHQPRSQRRHPSGH